MVVLVKQNSFLWRFTIYQAGGVVFEIGGQGWYDYRLLPYRGSQAMKFFNSHQIKCNLERHPTASGVQSWRGGMVRIDPLATLQVAIWTREVYVMLSGYIIGCGEVPVNEGSDEIWAEQEQWGHWGVCVCACACGCACVRVCLHDDVAFTNPGLKVMLRKHWLVSSYYNNLFYFNLFSSHSNTLLKPSLPSEFIGCVVLLCLHVTFTYPVGINWNFSSMTILFPITWLYIRQWNSLQMWV